jgi:hypothetical protein
MAEWLAALERFACLAATTSAEWMLVGSAASAVHGVDVQPGDVDLLAHTPADVFELAAVLPPAQGVADQSEIDPRTFLSTRSRSVVTFGDGAWTFGRWLLNGARVEVAHITGDDGLLRETSGREIWRHRQWMAWRGIQLPIVPLEVQLATMLSRDQTNRSQAARTRLQERGYDPDLLLKALAAQGIASPGPDVHQAQGQRDGDEPRVSLSVARPGPLRQWIGEGGPGKQLPPVNKIGRLCR